MRSALALLILLFFSPFCFAQNMNSGGPAENHFYQELPFELINGKIIIEVEIAGHKHKFLLDTGAPFTISDEIAAGLGITPPKQSRMADAYGNVAAAGIARVDEVKLGNVAFKAVPAFIGTNLIFKCLGVDGNIGSNLLRNTIIKFDNKNKTLIISDDLARLNVDKQNSIPLDMKKDKQSTPFFILNVGGNTTGDYYFDSGDAGFLSLSNTYLDVFKAHNACEVLASGYGSNSFGENGAENNNVKHRVLFPAITIGKAVFKNVRTETVFSSNGSGNNSIGVRLLDYGTLTLDYLHGELYFDPFTAEADLAEKSWPLSPTISDNKLVIGVVWDKMKDTVKPGLQIIAINGISYEQIDICNMLRQKSILQGKEQAIFTVKDDKGNLSKLEISKQ